MDDQICSPSPVRVLLEVAHWRKQRSVSRQPVVNYNGMKFMLRPDKTPATLAGKLVDIYDFPDGRQDIRWKGLLFSYSVLDQLQRANHAAIIENKRLGEVLAGSTSSRTSCPSIAEVACPRRSNQKVCLMKDRTDLLAQVTKSQTRAARLGRCDSDVSARRPRAVPVANLIRLVVD